MQEATLGLAKTPPLPQTPSTETWDCWEARAPQTVACPSHKLWAFEILFCPQPPSALGMIRAEPPACA